MAFLFIIIMVIFAFMIKTKSISQVKLSSNAIIMKMKAGQLLKIPKKWIESVILLSYGNQDMLVDNVFLQN